MTEPTVSFVVTIREVGHDPDDPTVDTTVYLVAISYRAYPESQPARYVSTDIEDAFVFTSIVAAEMAAVFVGGEVLRIEHKAVERG